MEDNIKVAKWLRLKLAQAKAKVTSLHDQLLLEEPGWHRDRMQNWLRKAEEDYRKLQRWTTLT
jgi:hypothetical protein